MGWFVLCFCYAVFWMCGCSWKIPVKFKASRSYPFFLLFCHCFHFWISFISLINIIKDLYHLLISGINRVIQTGCEIGCETWPFTHLSHLMTKPFERRIFTLFLLSKVAESTHWTRTVGGEMRGKGSRMHLDLTWIIISVQFLFWWCWVYNNASMLLTSSHMSYSFGSENSLKLWL